MTTKEKEVHFRLSAAEVRQLDELAEYVQRTRGAVLRILIGEAHETMRADPRRKKK